MPFSGDGKLMAALFYFFFPSSSAVKVRLSAITLSRRARHQRRNRFLPWTHSKVNEGTDNEIHLIVN